jgi:hypothetical protein
MGVAHFHEHIYARPTREPKDVGWHSSDELLELVGDATLRRLTEELRPALEGVDSNG